MGFTNQMNVACYQSEIPPWQVAIFLKFLFICFICMRVLSARMPVQHMYAVLKEGHTRASDALELWLLMGASHRVDAGNRPPIF